MRSATSAHNRAVSALYLALEPRSDSAIRSGSRSRALRITVRNRSWSCAGRAAPPFCMLLAPWLASSWGRTDGLIWAAPASARRRRAHSVIRPSCYSFGKCAIGRSTFLTHGHDPWITFVPRVRQPVAAAPMTLTAIAGRVISSTIAASSRTSPRRRRSGPSRWAGMIRRSPGPWRSGRSACSAAGPAQRHGGETPAAWVQASRTPLRQPPPSPQAGGPGKRGNTGS